MQQIHQFTNHDENPLWKMRKSPFIHIFNAEGASVPWLMHPIGDSAQWKEETIVSFCKINILAGLKKNSKGLFRIHIVWWNRPSETNYFDLWPQKGNYCETKRTSDFVKVICFRDLKILVSLSVQYLSCSKWSKGCDVPSVQHRCRTYLSVDPRTRAHGVSWAPYMSEWCP